MPYGLFDYVPDSGIHTMGLTPPFAPECKNVRFEDCKNFPNHFCCAGGLDPLEIECRMNGDASADKQSRCHIWWINNQCKYTGPRPNGAVGVSCPPRPQSPQPPQSGTGGIGNCPDFVVENGIRYKLNPPQTITRGNCEYILDATATVAPPPPPDRCPAGQYYFQGIKGIFGSIPPGCYTPQEYDTRKNAINGVFPIRR